MYSPILLVCVQQQQQQHKTQSRTYTNVELGAESGKVGLAEGDLERAEEGRGDERARRREVRAQRRHRVAAVCGREQRRSTLGVVVEDRGRGRCELCAPPEELAVARGVVLPEEAVEARPQAQVPCGCRCCETLQQHRVLKHLPQKIG